MKIRFYLLLPALLFIRYTVCNSQDMSEKILMTVANKEISAGEFLRMYKKSSEPGQKADVDEYLQQYINFRLKVADALSEGTDTTASFRNELNGYRNQLSQNYLTDTEAREKLLRKIYERSLTEINGWHILVNCPEGSSPSDTLVAWKKAREIRERILSGEPFDQVARGSSDDPSVRINGGNLGYFTVFQMISPFEDAAYALKEGEVSDPVKTPYGYHIIKVADRRPAGGKVQVAHIMKVSPPGSGEKETKEAEKSINELYDRLQKGESFSELAKKYSDDKQSASSGGKLNWFGTGEIISDFAEAAFSIKDTGNYTKPVRSPYGWHIIKLLGKKPHGTYEELRSLFESKINQSSLNSLSKKTFVNRLKEEYNFSINPTAYDWFLKNTDTLIIKGKAGYNRDRLPSGYLYSFADRQLSNTEFADFIEKRGSRIDTKDPSYFLRESVESLASVQLLKYEDSILEEKYPEFRYLMNEFHDGILLFDVSEKKIWNRVQEDSTGLQKYYDEHKDEYLCKRGIEATIYSLRSENGARSLYSAYRKYSRKPDTESLMKNEFNNHGDSLLIIRKGVWHEGDDPELDKLKWKRGVIRTRRDGNPSLIAIRRIIEPSPMPLEEIRGEMMAGYQEYLENEWIEQLKKKYTVKIDTRVFEEIKKRLKNE